MKIAILGNGYLAQAFRKSTKHQYSIVDRWRCYSISSVDFLENIKELAEADVIVNCIGISDTRYCESQENFEKIKLINGELPGLLSKHDLMINKRFVHISTGCLYDQSHRPCTEDDKLVAHCNYVVSKWIGEMGCDKQKDIIIRPRLLFSDYMPPNGSRNNLLLKLNRFDKFVDAFNTITYTHDIVNAIESLLENNCSGIYNVGCSEPITIYDIATKYLNKSDVIKITPEQLILSQNLHLVNNVMDVTKIEKYCKMTPLSKALQYSINKLKLEN